MAVSAAAMRYFMSIPLEIRPHRGASFRLCNSPGGEGDNPKHVSDFSVAT
jgi:hypothetical protein